MILEMESKNILYYLFLRYFQVMSFFYSSILFELKILSQDNLSIVLCYDIEGLSIFTEHKRSFIYD